MVHIVWQCRKCGSWMHKVSFNGKLVPVLEIVNEPYVVVADVVCPQCGASGTVTHHPDAPVVLWWEGPFEGHVTDDETFSYCKGRGYKVVDADEPCCEESVKEVDGVSDDSEVSY